jgi:Mrp family chromosome partitioning ATPase
MGRMLEALKRLNVPEDTALISDGGLRTADGGTTEGASIRNPPAAIRNEEGPQLQVVTAEEPEDEMPYIEVGGRGKPVDASPEVLPLGMGRAGAPSRRASDRPAEAGGPPFVPSSGCTVSALQPTLQGPRAWAPALAEPRPLTVAFEPCPAPAAPPAPRMAVEVVAFHQPGHPVSLQYHALLTQVALDAAEASAWLLLMTALAPGAGVTTALLNLAVCAAAGGREVVVVDANLRRPALAGRLGLTSGPGLREVLAGSAALEQALRRTAQERLLALTAGVGPGRDGALTAEAMRWVATWLRRRFDLVFVDGPAWEGGAEMAALVGASDRVLLVLDQQETAQPEVRAATRTIARMGGQFGGLLVTR